MPATAAPTWLPNDYCPLPLRTVARVLADAKPAFRGGTYRWWCAGSDWWGVDPANGVIPSAIAARMPRRERFATAEEAMAALRQACDGLRLTAAGEAA